LPGEMHRAGATAGPTFSPVQGTSIGRFRLPATDRPIIAETMSLELVSEINEETCEAARGVRGSSATGSSAPGYLPYLVFALSASLYFFPLMQLFLRSLDEGTLVDGAVRIVHGQLLGRDFLEVMGPGTFYWLALFFKLFGVTFLASRICLFVSSLITALCMYFLTRRVCHTYQLLPCTLLFATYFSTYWPEISHHVDSNCFALLAVACMVLWQDSRKNWLLIAAGALTGATTLALQPKGILLLIAFLAWLAIQHWRQSTALTALIWVAGGCLGVIALMLGYFWSQGALHDLIYANVVWPSRNYSAMNEVPYAFATLDHFHQWVVPVHGINWTVGGAAVLVIPYFFVAAIPALALLLGASDGVTAIRPEIALYWLAGTAFWLSELHRKDIAHLVFGSPLLIILCIFYMQKRPTKGFSLALQALSIASVSLAGCALVIALVARPMTTRVGHVRVASYDPVLTAIEEHVPRGGDIFIYPFPPMYYFLSATTNPTRYSFLLYNYHTPTQFDEVIRSLEQRRVKYVLWDRHIEDSILSKVFPSMRPTQFIIGPYLESHYKPIWARDGVLLMERNNDDPHPATVPSRNSRGALRNTNGLGKTR
jgi:4-amino-4-deoxy-L-arabinose transferase-like glycosyltransferase